MPQSNFLSKLIALVLVVAVVCYMGFQIYDSLNNPIVTETAATFTVEDTLTATGFIIRDETLIPSPSGAVSIEAGEGKRLGTGQCIASVYADQSALETKQQLGSLDARIAMLENAASASDSIGADGLESEIYDVIASLNGLTDSHDLLQLPDISAELQSLLFRREIAFGDSAEIGALLDTLKAERDALAGQHNVSSGLVSAPFSGTFSSLVDGYETALTPALLDGLTVESLGQMETLRDEGLPDGHIGKMIRGYTWYYAVSMDTADAALLAPGSAATLRFASGFDGDIVMNVVSLGTDENGKTAVVFSSGKYLTETISLRRQTADVIYKTYNGIKVPGRALRMQDGVTGVYCLVGLQAQFKPVNVIYTAETYYLVEYDRVEKGALRPGDEIIVAARQLYDGKVVK